jgi:hypothetical protein
LAAGVLLVLVPGAPARAQDAQAILREASVRIGAEGLESLSFSGSGSGYSYNDENRRQYSRVQSYQQDVRFEAGESHVEARRLEGIGPEGVVEVRDLTGDMSLPEAVERWFVPHLFLAEARYRAVRTSQDRALGLDYTVLTFDMLGYSVSAYLDSDDRIDHLHLQAEGGPGLDVRYLGYADHGGVLFPRMLSLEQEGRPLLVLVVSEVVPNAD